MEMTFRDRLVNGWNAFMNRSPTRLPYWEHGASHSRRPDRVRFSGGNERSIVTAVYNRIALDAATIDIEHVKLDEEDRYVETIESELNDCFSLEANTDQTGRAFWHDVYVSMMDEGHVAIVPVDADGDPTLEEDYKIFTLRTGKVTEWWPNNVKVKLYNERTGEHEEVILPKRVVAIVENPFYAIMNEPNSTGQRLIKKLNLLDRVDEQSGSGKLDLIIQLPYVIKSEARRQQAEQRRKDIEMQLSNSKYGIAYTDGTERVTQLNRSLENNLLKQIEYLRDMYYSQLGMTQSILDGTADEKTMANYYSRIIEPMVAAVVDELKRKFLTKAARKARESICYFRDPFKLMPVESLAETADKLTRNEIVSKNEIRQKIGMKPSKDPKADQLINSNIAQSKQAPAPSNTVPNESNEGGKGQNGEL